MPAIVVPFRGSRPKRRLAASDEERAALAFAMFEDVLAACSGAGDVVVVTDDARASRVALGAGAEVVDDPGWGQAVAVAAALAPGRAAVVVNADLPCATAEDIALLLAATPVGGLALVDARDGTTNALSLTDGDLFAPVYGAGSAARFCARAAALGAEAVRVAIPNLADDVDTLEDFLALQHRVGPRTRRALTELPAERMSGPPFADHLSGRPLASGKDWHTIGTVLAAFRRYRPCWARTVGPHPGVGVMARWAMSGRATD